MTDKVKVYVPPQQPEEPSLPEKAWIQHSEGDDPAIVFNIHKYSKEWRQREDVTELFYFKWINFVEVKVGKRGGFKGLVIDLNLEDGPKYKVSKSHRELAGEIVKILRKNGVKVVKTEC